MTEEELARFALVLRECNRIRAMIAEDAAAAGAHGGDKLPLLSVLPAVEQPSESTPVIAA